MPRDDVSDCAGLARLPGGVGGQAVPRIKRVLMTADAVGGVWSYALDLATEFRARGIDVTLATMGPAPSDAQLQAASRVATVLSSEFRLEWMDDPWEDVARAGDWLLEAERTARADVVHLNGFCHAALPWRAPVIVVGHSCVRSWWRAVHGTEMPAHGDRYRREVTRGLGGARLVVAPTVAMLRALHREYGTFGAARVIPNGRPGPRVGEACKEPIVFSAGRVWDAAKNIDSVCSVAASIPWSVYVAGDTLASGGNACLPGYARYLGRLEPQAMEDWFRRASIYALPARYEPFGLSVLEAALAGCALVLGDVSSLRENWAGAAVFVPPDNRCALASALRRLIGDDHERTRLAGRAELRARQFSVERMADEYLRAYEDAVVRP
jgi:glycosyltransferase involved in cell wall biosynthesis